MKKIIRSLALPLCLAASQAMAGNLVDVQVVDRTSGQNLETWQHGGRLYVAGTPGNRYAVSIRNHTAGRVLTVVSVDGVNAVSGQTAATTQSGYVLSPWRSTEIAGWRKNMDEVAAFYFTSVSDSYAGRTDRPQNVGVIGVAVFTEYQPPRPQPQPHYYQKDSADRAPASSAASGAAAPAAPAEVAKPEARRAQSEEKLGTGHGERIDSHVDSTNFRRASTTPAEVITIYYDSRANLVARGIIPSHRRNSRPDPFPGGFVPDPR